MRVNQCAEFKINFPKYLHVHAFQFTHTKDIKYSKKKMGWPFFVNQRKS